MIKKRYVIACVWGVCFLVGYFTWKIFHTGKLFQGKQMVDGELEDMDFTVYVGDYLITPGDIDWEYRFYVDQLKEGSTPQAAQAISNKDDKPIVELYNKIMADLIERKLLYQFIKKDEKFDINEASRFTSCLQQWSAVISKQIRDFAAEGPRSYLKAMLCEKDILSQYVQERIVSSIKLTDEDLRGYYASHKQDFHVPARVTVRQVVLASEAEAKKVRAKINANNFSQLSREYSISPEASQGGVLGPFAKGDLPSVFDVAFEMGQGEIQGILKSTYGFHIIMLDRKFAKAELDFEAAKGKIERILMKKRQDEEYKKWVETALNTIPIKSSRAL